MKKITRGSLVIFLMFLVATAIEGEIVKYELDFDGDGTIDNTSNTLQEITHTYNNEGLYNASITVTDSEGKQFSNTLAINVYPVPPLDEKWDGMKDSLESGNVEKALDQFTSQSKESYREVFNILGDKLPELASKIQDGDGIQLIYIKDNEAKYRIRKEQLIDGKQETVTYYIYFVKDEDGLWKIDNF